MKDGCSVSGGRQAGCFRHVWTTTPWLVLYYKFPVFQATASPSIVGPLARNTEMMGMKPTADTVKTLNMFGGQFGAGNVYNKETGGLVGVIWKQKVKGVAAALSPGCCCSELRR